MKKVNSELSTIYDELAFLQASAKITDPAGWLADNKECNHEFVHVIVQLCKVEPKD